MRFVDMQRVPLVHRLILESLTLVGHEAYVVGGAVRDLLLGLEPKDFDITTSATPEQVADIFPDTDLVGAHFAVSLVTVQGVTVEVATFRTDGSYSDSRRPDNVQVTLDAREDVLRRDFTVNALLLDKDGEVVDYVGGVPDLMQRTLRTVGDAQSRLLEDPVRMLRAVRFVANKRLEPTRELFEAILANRGSLAFVAPERTAKELTGILTGGDAATGLGMLMTTGLLKLLLPEVDNLRGVPQNPKYHPEGDVWVHTLGLLEQLPEGVSPTLAWAALLHDTGKYSTLAWDKEGQPTFHGHEDHSTGYARKILNRLKFSGEFTSTVTSLVNQHMAFRNLPLMRRAKQLRFVRQEHFGELMKLHHMDATAGSGNLENWKFAFHLFAATPEEVKRPVRLLTGHDLINDLGLKPGPAFKKVLEEVENMQLEGTVTTREQALIAAADMMREVLG